MVVARKAAVEASLNGASACQPIQRASGSSAAARIMSGMPSHAIALPIRTETDSSTRAARSTLLDFFQPVEELERLARAELVGVHLRQFFAQRIGGGFRLHGFGR